MSVVPSQLKIDNWGNFFMQRLNNLAKKDEYCDYTIRSQDNESFKVHRVVLNTCSDYFVSHPNSDTSMTMPEHLDFNAVKSVVMFMYTGQLYYSEDSRMSLIEVADMLQVTVLLKLLESQPGVVKPKINPRYHSTQPSSSRTHSAIALNQYRPAKKPVVQNNNIVRSPPEHTPASTFINTMKVKDVLSENKPMRFDCDVDDVPEFIENTFELPKYDSAPLIKQENVESAKAMLKRSANGELIDGKNNKTQVIKCEAQSLPSSPAEKKLKIVSDTAPENSNSKVVQEILKKFPHLLQSKGNIKLKIMSSNSLSQFESIIINTPNSVEKILPAGTDVKEPLTTHKVKPDLMNTKGPWLCKLCGTDANPLKLDSYYKYRRHLVEKHNEKEDTRICEYCGHFSVRKSLQIHHMYTKHDIKPPSEFKFPKCDHCGFVATTDVHLKRHKTNDKCGSKPQVSKPDVNYTCPECARTFRSSLMLKGHLRNFHKVEDMTSSSSSPKELLIPIIDSASPLPPGTKILAENKSEKIEEVVLNDDDVLNDTVNSIKDEVGDCEETTEVETVTLEDAAQDVKEKVITPSVPVDITEEWDDFDDGDIPKKEESDKEDENRDGKPSRIELDE